MSIQLTETRTTSLRLSPAGWRWLAIALVVALDAFLLARTGLRLSTQLLLGYGKALGIWTVLTVVYLCFRHNPRLAAVTQMVMQASLFSLSATILTYLAQTYRAPLMDGQFSALDARLGFHWLSWFQWVEHHSWIKAVLAYAYGSIAIQFFATMVLLPWIGRQRLLSEFCNAAAVALLIIIPISAALPALGAATHFAVGTPPWVPHVLALRAGTMTVIGAQELHGVVEFPSFHTVLAILLVLAMRWNPFALALSAGLNALVILSIPTVGSHYLVDVIAGALVCLPAVLAARRIEAADAGGETVAEQETVA